MVMAWSVDRLGRSLQDLVAFLSELHAIGIELFLHQQDIDTTTPSGKAMFQNFEQGQRRRQLFSAPCQTANSRSLCAASGMIT